MSLRITTVTLVVKNQAKALEFYTEKVGFEKKTDVTQGGYRYVTVSPKGQDLELQLSQEDSLPGGLKPGGIPPIFLTVDDCRKIFNEMKAKGVEFKQAQPEENPWSITATFSDPDGNLFQINQFLRRSP